MRSICMVEMVKHARILLLSIQQSNTMLFSSADELKQEEKKMQQQHLTSRTTKKYTAQKLIHVSSVDSCDQI